MKIQTCKIKIKQLVNTFGGRKKLAEKLSVTERYVRYLEKGCKPGKRLYRDIYKLYNSTRKVSNDKNK